MFKYFFMWLGVFLLVVRHTRSYRAQVVFCKVIKTYVSCIVIIILSSSSSSSLLLLFCFSFLSRWGDGRLAPNRVLITEINYNNNIMWLIDEPHIQFSIIYRFFHHNIVRNKFWRTYIVFLLVVIVCMIYVICTMHTLFGETVIIAYNLSLPV